MLESINQIFTVIHVFYSKIFFFDALFFIEDVSLPFILLVLFFLGVFLTFKMNFVNFRLFYHAVLMTAGVLDKGRKKISGDISHFKALTTALSATVGLGNIAGVAIAVSTGGPGAVFWMIFMGFLSMSVKFTECSLAVMFREQRKDGSFMGGPMKYLKEGLAQKNWPRLGIFLSTFFAVLCIGGSFGGGIAFQVNQSVNAISISVPILQDFKWIYALTLMFLVGLVIIGGVKRISEVSSRIVPFMFFVYLAMALYVLIVNYNQIPSAFALIFKEAFSTSAAYGGFIGTLVVGLQRAAFSNEAGLGSSPIVHSAAKVSHPIEEGVVALLEPFLDTVVICTTTALVIIVTNSYNNPEFAELVINKKGAALTSQALSEVSNVFPYILSFSVFLFAFSTIISWSYYGERCFSFLFGEKYDLIYKFLVLTVIFLGTFASSTVILDFCDSLILSMSLPNAIGILFLSGKVKKSLKDYISKLKKSP
ncbi:MAG: alanine:cation symporter family protein [Bdellovibrionales bacterium]|nr:alanine:cation symporter family protein [Bdellovibrionales bacterium]